MRKRNSLTQLAIAAILAGSITLTGQANAKSDFDALLADVTFGAAQDATEQVVSTPANGTMAMPATETEPLPLPTQPLVDPSAVVHGDGPVGQPCQSQCGGQCGSKCGSTCGLKDHHFITEGFCQPYTPPQLPTSTFYQYWRSNACNVHVWDGYKNRCPAHIDLSLHHNQSCGCGGGCSGGCTGGPCNIQPAAPANCGPLPSEWLGRSDCDSCDGQ